MGVRQTWYLRNLSSWWVFVECPGWKHNFEVLDIEGRLKKDWEIGFKNALISITQLSIYLPIYSQNLKTGGFQNLNLSFTGCFSSPKHLRPKGFLPRIIDQLSKDDFNFLIALVQLPIPLILKLKLFPRNLGHFQFRGKFSAPKAIPGRSLFLKS